MMMHGKNIEVYFFPRVGTQVIGQKCEMNIANGKHNNNNNNNVWKIQVPELRNAV